MIKTVKVRPKNTLSISETQKMVKTTKVKVLNDPKSSDFTTTKPFPDQDDKTRRLVKLFVIFCLGQAIVVVTVGSLFGVLLIAKAKDIDRLKQQSDALNCTWENWATFSTCSHTCGGGTKYRTRSCQSILPPAGHDWLPRTEIDIQMCNIQTCPVHGVWGDWTAFSACSVSCGGGTQTRERSCDNPSPAHGGDTCLGNGDETEACNTISCPVHGAWGSWTDSSDCSRSCDGGIRYRIRMCNNPSPSFGGNWCPGSVTEYQTCNTEACPERISAFTATHPRNGPTPGTIRFEYYVNNFGSDYDTTTGQFTCEIPGIYIFHLHILEDEGAQWASCYIRYNGSIMVWVEADPEDGDTDRYGNYGTSNSVILELNRGDVVDLGGCTDYTTMDDTGTGTSFTGYLLYPA